MSFFEPLSDAQLARLSNPNQSYGDATQSDVTDDKSIIFDQSMGLKTTLDQYEALAMRKPSWQVLAVLTNCEYKLWCLNLETPVRQNPWLSHWIVALQLHTPPTTRKSSQEDQVTTEQIAEVRAEWITRLLVSKDVASLSQLTPRDLCQDVIIHGHRTSFDIEPYVRMLVEEGIYDEETSSTTKTDNQKAKAKPFEPSSNQWKEDIKQKLRLQPEDAVQDLIHLPLDIPHLDALTTLLAEGAFQGLSIDPAPVVTSFIQHALRQIEQMGGPPPTNRIQTNGEIESREPMEYGKEAQSRAVRLLLLFMKSLIRKQLLGIEVLYFEIQEICVRYVWIKEVRDFRSWVEEGERDG